MKEKQQFKELKEGENTWGNRLLRLTMNNTMIQWVTENTRFRGEDKPS